jgi:hypothetical protein
MLKSIQKLCDRWQAIEKKLKEIRAKCPHKKYRVGLWMDAPGRINNAKICERCGDNIGLVFSNDLPDPSKIFDNVQYLTIPSGGFSCTSAPDDNKFDEVNGPYFDRMGM